MSLFDIINFIFDTSIGVCVCVCFWWIYIMLHLNIKYEWRLKGDGDSAEHGVGSHISKISENKNVLTHTQTHSDQIFFTFVSSGWSVCLKIRDAADVG